MLWLLILLMLVISWISRAVWLNNRNRKLYIWPAEENSKHRIYIKRKPSWQTISSIIPCYLIFRNNEINIVADGDHTYYSKVGNTLANYSDTNFNICFNDILEINKIDRWFIKSYISIRTKSRYEHLYFDNEDEEQLSKVFEGIKRDVDEALNKKRMEYIEQESNKYLEYDRSEAPPRIRNME